MIVQYIYRHSGHREAVSNFKLIYIHTVTNIFQRTVVLIATVQVLSKLLSPNSLYLKIPIRKALVTSQCSLPG